VGGPRWGPIPSTRPGRFGRLSGSGAAPREDHYFQTEHRFHREQRLDRENHSVREDSD
jgi:hypothetical protein